MIDQPKRAFTQVQSAIVTLRRGKSDPHWLEAAEFLIERAALDTKLLLEAQRVLDQEKLADTAKHSTGIVGRWSRTHFMVLSSVFCLLALIEALLLGVLWQSQC